MLISYTVFFILFAIFFVGIYVFRYVSAFIFSNIDEKKDCILLISLIFYLILFALYAFYTPVVIRVSDCDTYDKKVLLFPTEGMTYGKVTYVINQSERILSLEEVVFGSGEYTDSDQVCYPGEMIKCKGSIKYVMKNAPPVERISGSSLVAFQLNCIPTQEERIDKLMRIYNRHLAENFDQIEYLYKKGALSERLNLQEEANAIYLHAIKVHNEGYIRSYYTGLCYRHLKRWDEAIAVFRDYLKYESSRVSSLNNMGYCYIGLGDMEQAKKCFSEARTMKKTPDNYLGLAIVAYQQGNMDDLKKILKICGNCVLT